MLRGTELALSSEYVLPRILHYLSRVLILQIGLEEPFPGNADILSEGGSGYVRPRRQIARNMAVRSHAEPARPDAVLARCVE
jgi:hypothetical protein